MTDSKKIDDGGPAFATVATDYHGRGIHDVRSVGGMSLRDWFAGQALAGLLACNETRGDGAERYPELCDVVAEASYGYADAMIAARKAGDA